MKTKQLITLLMAAFLVIPVLAQKSNPNRETIVFNVAMDCHNCQQKIEKNIAFEKGVKDIKTDLEKQTVVITYDKRRNTVEKLQEALKKLGYESKVVITEQKATDLLKHNE